jgi:hypothetical protein
MQPTLALGQQPLVNAVVLSPWTTQPLVSSYCRRMAVFSTLVKPLGISSKRKGSLFFKLSTASSLSFLGAAFAYSRIPKC